MCARSSAWNWNRNRCVGEKSNATIPPLLSRLFPRPPMPTATETILARHDAYMTHNYARIPTAMVRGEGAYLWDAEGRKILDLFAGFGAPILGHCHPELVAAVHEQAQKLWHVGNLLHTEPQTRLAEAISKHAAPGSKVFLCQ